MENQWGFETDSITKEIWLLKDQRIIDSLRTELKCNIDKLSDGDKEYQIFIFKDNESFDWYCFNNKKYFDLGKLKSKLRPVNTNYYYFPSKNATNHFADSLTTSNITYTISPYGPEAKEVTEYEMKITLTINQKSKLLSGESIGYYDCKAYALKELRKLYEGSDFSFTERREEWNSTAPGDMSSKGGVNFVTQTQLFVTSDKPFTFDTSKLSKTDLITHYEICPLFTITTYIEK
jgi:hypothetical protein